MKKVLVVDDSNTIRQQAGFIIEKAGYETEFAQNGQEGLNKLSANIGFVLLDVNMPVMSGLEMLKELRAIPEYAELPVFILTTESSSELINQAKELKASGWMMKPFEPNDLVNVIRKYDLSS